MVDNMIDKNISGAHSSFYYFGLSHLYVNMFNYIKAGSKRNEFVCLFTNNKLYNKIKRHMGIYSNKCHKMCYMSEILEIYRHFGISEVRDRLIQYENKILNKGYSGIRIIIDVKYIISQTSKDYFLKFDMDMSNIIFKIKTSTICIYDFEEYMNNNNFIDDEIIEQSYKTHYYRLYGEQLVDSKKLINV